MSCNDKEGKEIKSGDKFRMRSVVINAAMIIAMIILAYQNTKLSSRFYDIERRLESIEGKLDYLQVHSEDLIRLMVNRQTEEVEAKKPIRP